MASIITATVSSGLTQQADNSGVLQLASGTGNLVTVPSVTGTAMVSGNMPAFSAYASAGASITGGVASKIAINTEEFDTASCYNTSTYRFTPNVAGYYFVTGAVRAPSITGEFATIIFKNGATTGRQAAGSGTQSVIIPVCSCIVSMNGSTDYLELYAYTANTLTYDSGINTYFQAVLLRAA